MAITGKFLADFSSFNAEVQKAEAQLVGFESQATAAAAAANQIGATSTGATTGVTGLTTATSALATSQNVATLSTEQLDAMIAGQTVALGTVTTATEAASVASGAYGSVLFTTVEAEVAATTATAGLATSLGTAATAATGFVASIAPWVIVAGALGKAIGELINKHREEFQAEVDAANQRDLYERATREAGYAVTSLTEAVKILEAAQRHQLLINPEVAYQAYRQKLDDAASAAKRLSDEQDALAQGGLAHGEIVRQESDIVQQMTEATKKATEAKRRHEEATRAAAKADQEYFDQVVALSNKLYDIEHPMRDNIFLMEDLGRLGKQASTGVEELFKSMDALAKKLAEVERQGIPAVFTQGVDLTKLGTHVTEVLTEAQKEAIKAADAMGQAFIDEFNRLPLMMADALRSGDFTSIGRQMGEFIGAAIGGPIGEAIGSFLPEIGQAIANFFGHLFGTGGFFDAIDKKMAEILRKVREYQEEQQAAADAAKKAADEVENAKHAGGARSNEELQHAADIAKKAYEEAAASGKYNQENLDKLYLAYMQAMAAAGDETAKAWLKARDATKKTADDADAAMKKLLDRRDELTKAISQEAPEAEMGVIEKQMRAERDAVQKQIDDANKVGDAQGDAAADAKELWEKYAHEWNDYVKAEGDNAAGHLKEAFDFTLHIPIAFDMPGMPIVPMASGGSGVVTRPTLFLAGEAGPEAFAFNRGVTSVAAGGSDQLIAELRALRAALLSRPTIVSIAGREIVRATHTEYDRNVDGALTELRQLAGTL